MDYILIKFEDGTEGFQEIFNGNILRTTDLAGNTLAVVQSAVLISASPTKPSWALPDPVVVDSTAPQAIQISKLQFLDAFEDDELEAIYTAAKSVVKIEIFLDKFKLAEFIDISDPKLQGGIHALESAGLLQPGRASQILVKLGA
jgi:hypothetical protein